jgi:adenylate cyclase class 2
LDKVNALNASLLQARVFETNLRFDTPAKTLTRNYQVVRLRHDTQSRLTYKSAALPGKEVSTLKEIEFTVGDFDAARSFLEALGYEVSIAYEKYRTTYKLDDTHLMIDEMPFGNFLEIEGENVSAIKGAAAKLLLDWNARCIDSYMVLFNHLQEELTIAITNLTFSDLSHIKVGPDTLGLKPADRAPKS